MRTYGTLEIVPCGHSIQWCLRAEAHVVQRAKRVFAQVSKKQQGALLLSDTVDVARDLEWFLQRYPLQVDAAAAAHLHAVARLYDARAATVQRILSRTEQLPTFELALPARRYQAEAAAMLLATKRLLVGDALGLGKTATAIAALSDRRTRPAVVVTMTHLPMQWERELQRFAPQLRVFRPRRGEPTDADRQVLTGAAPPDVVLLSYSKLAGWAQTLVESFQPRSAVFDEVQELRTGQGTDKGAAAALLAGACAYRLGLSATPIYNYGGEAFNLFQFLAPGELGTRSEFATEWAGGGFDEAGKEKIKDPRAFGAHLRDIGLFLRRTIRDVVDEVPTLADPIRIPQVVDSDVAALAEAKTAAAALARIILSETASGIDKMRAGGEIDWRMRQATGIAKAPYVAAFVRLILASNENERVLLFGWHHAVYDLWAEALKDFKPVRYTGDESPTQKEAARKAFVAGDSRVLIMSLRAGAGLDGLQKVSRTVVFGELDWSPGVHEQCIGRVHRPGQDNVVQVFFLHSLDGSDPVIVEVLGIKKAQAAGIVDPNAPVLEQGKDAGAHIRMLAQQCLAAAAPQEVPA